MKLFSRLKGRPLLCGSLIYLSTGYLLYFAALYVGQAPECAAGFIQAMKALVIATATAEKVAERLQSNPFPAQVVITYCTISTLFLTAWFTRSVLGKPRARDKWLSAYSRQGFGPLRSAAFALILLLTLLLYPTILFIHESRSLSWQAMLLFSPSIISASLLLFAAFMPAMAAPAATCFLYLAMDRRPAGDI
jgi:hypothetical protein